VKQALAPITASTSLPQMITAAGERASLRFQEFFAANIRNPHTRRACGRAVTEFLAWCDAQGVRSVAAEQPLHVAAWIEQQARRRAMLSARAPSLISEAGSSVPFRHENP
jgi:hypothetical protein